MRERIKRAGDIILQLLFPRRCPVCDKIVVPYGKRICVECEKTPEVMKEPLCVRCGRHSKEEGTLCENCKREPHSFKRGRIVYEYDSVRTSLYRFKYAGRKEYGEYFGQQAAFVLRDYINEVSPDCLIPVPLHKSRERKRGYNQAKIIADAISAQNGIKVLDNFLCRSRETKVLRNLNASERKNNLKNAFIVSENVVKLNRVLIVDDIFTTGSTVDAAAEVLMAAGVGEVYYIALAGGANNYTGRTI